jgi:putative glutamine amidotransferase
MKKPVIGITCNFYPGKPDKDFSRGYDLNYLGVKYPEYVRRAGGIPVLLPIVVQEGQEPKAAPPLRESTLPFVPPRIAGGKIGEIRDLVDGFDGLLLSGGVDVAPEFYDEEILYQQFPGETPRSRFEIELLRAAHQAGKPVLGICRGIQLINVAFGGTLYQDLALQCELGNHELKEGKPPPYHDVQIERDSRLFAIIGKTPIHVNSSHHQAVKDVAKGFTITARSEDGVIEGIENHDSTPIIGVQWHPERMENPDADTLIRFLVELAGRSK